MHQLRFRFRQVLTLLLLPLGYLGYYYCRSAWAVIQPVLLEQATDLPGVSLSALGWVAVAGTLAYAMGKLISAPVIDAVGGRSLFTFGLAISVLATVALGLGAGISSLLLAWVISQIGQSLGWGSLLKMASRWFSGRSTGQVLGLASLSYLFGDAWVRWHLGHLLETGYGWRGIALAAAAIAAGAAVLVWLLLYTEPPESHTLPLETEPEPALSFWVGLRPLARHPAFWMVLLASLCLHTVRETFLQWSVTFLAVGGKLTAAEAARLSSVFALAGGVSALLFGWLADLLGPRLRSSGVALALALLGLLFVAWSSRFGDLERESLAWMLAGAGLLLMGPFSLLAGVMALDLGSRRAGAATANLTDGVGYLGGLLAGLGIVNLVDEQGWAALFPLLAAASWVAALALFLYGWFYVKSGMAYKYSD
jgi:sugar phosphate permease